MKLSEALINLLAITSLPLLGLYLYELIHNYEEEENDKVPLEEKEGDQY